MTHPQSKRVRRRIGVQPIGRGRGKKLGLRKRRRVILRG